MKTPLKACGLNTLMLRDGFQVMVQDCCSSVMVASGVGVGELET